jgi:hypothetical protein
LTKNFAVFSLIFPAKTGIFPQISVEVSNSTREMPQVLFCDGLLPISISLIQQTEKHKQCDAARQNQKHRYEIRPQQIRI